MMNKIINGLKKILNGISDVVFVKKCASCGELLEYNSESRLCEKCASEWELEKMIVCPRCRETQIDCRCGFGKKDVDSVRHLVSYTHGENDIISNKIVYALKKSNDDNVFEFVAGEMADNIIDKKRLSNTVVVGIPRNPNAIKEYGYDHAKKLAKKVAALIGVEYADVLAHRGGKSEQKKLNKQQREQNARDNCYLKNGSSVRVKGKNILLIDDICTTGAMTGICAELLKKAGAKRVDCVLAAKNENSIK